MVERHPEPWELVVTEEDHEVGQVAVILAEAADHEHEVHPQRVAAEREEEALAKTEQAGVAPEQVDAQGEHGVGEVFAPEVEREIADVEETRVRREGVERGRDDDGENADGQRDSAIKDVHANPPAHARARGRARPVSIAGKG